jgi:hypothetical protein
LVSNILQGSLFLIISDSIPSPLLHLLISWYQERRVFYQLLSALVTQHLHYTSFKRKNQSGEPIWRINLLSRVEKTGWVPAEFRKAVVGETILPEEGGRGVVRLL